MVFGNAVSTFETFVWIWTLFQGFFFNLVTVHPKSIKLGQMTNLNLIFHVVVSVYRSVKI